MRPARFLAVLGCLAVLMAIGLRHGRLAAGQGQPPFGSLDTPAVGAANLAGEVAVTGWALDDSGIDGVDLYRSPVPGEATATNGMVFVGTATMVMGARPDVAAAYPSYPGRNSAGWGYMLLANMLPNHGDGTFTLAAYARTGDGANDLIAARTVTFASSHSTQPFGTIDTPAQGATVSGSVVNFGWALTPEPNAISADGSTINVYIDGAFVGHPVYNNYRNDIATVFPGYANSNGAVGYFVFDSTTLPNGLHTIAWQVTDNGGHSQGIGSRFFTVSNTPASGSPQPAPSPQPPAPAPPPGGWIAKENAKPGTTDWKLTDPALTTGAIEGYGSLTSVNRGGRIKFFVNTVDPTYTLEIFRMGYYQGLGGRRMGPPVTLNGTKQVMPTADPTTGLIECNWINPYVLDVPNSSDPTDWMSGFYYVKLTGSSGRQAYIAFVVRDDARPSDLILAQTVDTAQAYNVWGGKSLYGTIENRSDTANAARKVSFDRPYYGDETFGAGFFSNKNDFRFWEWGMVQFLESNGYDVAYATNIDVDQDPNLLVSHKAFLSVGHDEYWSWKMRDHVESARDAGVSLGFFSANTSYWQVRFEPSVSTGADARVMVGYKDYWQQDPITPAYLKTARFRSNPPVNRSEDQMMGVMYITQSRQPFVVEDASHWVMSGTGLKNGDVLTNPDGSFFVGYEVDAIGPKSPANTQRVAHSPATSHNANFSDMVTYRAPSGATVFSSGSILWTYDVPAIVQITKNVLARLVNGSFNDTIPARPSLPAPFSAGVDIGDVGRPGFVSLAGPDSFTLNGGGQDVVANSTDALYYAYKTLTGDGEMVVRMTGLQLYWDNRAGIMIRESLAPGARYVSIVSRPSESKKGSNPIGVNEGAELKVRDAAGTIPKILAAQDLPMPNWLKLSRTGDTFAAYLSADGITWTFLGMTTMSMPQTVFIGASVAGAQHGVWVTASFDHVSVTK
jgi:hypothetical protein